MRTKLQIGEIAQLLGITQKALRHYHKVGLLQEPERSDGGYRLYSAADLLRVQRIRRLQALGLSLKQIKLVLGDPEHEQTLRAVLHTIDEELAAQIRVLEQRRASIKKILEENAPETPPSPTLAYVQEHLGDYLAHLSPELRELETKTYTLLDGFNWPPEYRESIEKLTQYFEQHPALYQHLLVLAERLAALNGLPEDAPEIMQLVEDCVEYGEALQILFKDVAALLASVSLLPKGPQASTMSDLLGPHISPAHRRFAEEMMRRYPNFLCTLAPPL